jgi:predicted membrane protein
VRIVATRRTALLAGAGTTLSLTLFNAWAPHGFSSPATSRLVYLAAALLLWMVPGIVFVTGFDPRRWNPEFRFSPAGSADLREIGIRTCFWYGGSFAGWLAMSFVAR